MNNPNFMASQALYIGFLGAVASLGLAVSVSHSVHQEDRSSLAIQKTMPPSNSEAATMYKLKGQSSNMQIGQGFK